MSDPIEDGKNEAVLGVELYALEERYFPGVMPTAEIEICDIDGPAELNRETRKIHVDPIVARWPKTRRIFMLHELIHHCLLVTDGDPDAEEGARFQAEVNRLWREGAYKGLL